MKVADNFRLDLMAQNKDHSALGFVRAARLPGCCGAESCMVGLQAGSMLGFL